MPSNFTYAAVQAVLDAAPDQKVPTPGDSSSAVQPTDFINAPCRCSNLPPLLDETLFTVLQQATCGCCFRKPSTTAQLPICPPAPPASRAPPLGQDPSMLYYCGLYIYADVDFNQSVYVRVSPAKEDIMDMGWHEVYREPGPGPERSPDGSLQPFRTESPHISVYNDAACERNRFIMLYSSITRNIISVLMTESDNPLGKWTYKGVLDGIQGYDPNLMFHPRGLYLLYSNFDRLNIVRMSEKEPWLRVSEPTTIAVPDQPWEKSHGKLVEAPASIVIGAVASVFYSSNAYYLPNYATGVLRAKASANPLDAASWVKHSLPVCSSAPEKHVYGPGSGTFFTDPSKQLWWAYGGFSNPEGVPRDAPGRTVRMQPVGIMPDGSVCLGTPRAYPVAAPPS